MVEYNKIYNLDCFDFLSNVDDNQVDLAIIDPPYNMKKAEWDTFTSEEAFFIWTFRWIDALLPKLKKTASLYIFNTPYNAAYILQHLISRKMTFQNWITWDKRDGLGYSKKKYSNGQETILFFTKSKNYTFNYEDIRVPYQSTERIIHASKKGILKNGKRWFPNQNGKYCGEVWHYSSERHKTKENGKLVKMGHLTPKPTDMSKRPMNYPEEELYAQFCEEVKMKIGKGSQDAMRKNLFVDFHRMRFIDRYDKNGQRVSHEERSSIKYVSLTPLGKKLIEAKDSINKYYIFSKGLDNLIGGTVNQLIEIFTNSDYNIKNITLHEYMFFVSAIYSNYSFNIDIPYCIELINSYRCLTKKQRELVIESLSETMKPRNYTGDKTAKRDFHNWINKNVQLFTLLGQTAYFELKQGSTYEDMKLSYRLKDKNDFEETTYLERSNLPKIEYAKNHNLMQKVKGFEFHHIVPLSWSEDPYQYKKLDEWRNLLYIDGYSHSVITQSKNKYIKMRSLDINIILADLEGNQIDLDHNKNAKYDSNLLPEMIKYNTDLLRYYIP